MKFQIKHGKYGTTEYQSWRAMKARCQNPTDQAYDSYGGRGIEVCERWQLFENFFEDMGLKPSRSHSIDRNDNSKGYYKENCKWATSREQQNNTRVNHLITFQGTTRTLAEWGRCLGIHPGTINSRLHYGWTVIDALTIQVRSKQQNETI